MFDPSALLAFLNGTNPLFLFIAQILLCGGLIMVLFRYWGLLGLYLYMALATIGGNLAVLKIAHFPFYGEPIALGTVLFMSLFLCSDIINEYFGKKKALLSVQVGFISYLIFFAFIYGILSYAPMEGNRSIHEALLLLFTPAPAIFFASLIAYFVSQYTDVFLYNALRKLTRDKYLWFRSFTSTLLGAFLDNTLFSVLLWGFFAAHPKGFHEIFWTYIVGVFLMRVLLTFVNVAFMYGVKRWPTLGSLKNSEVF